MVYLYNGMLLSADTYNVDEYQDYSAELKKPHTKKNVLYMKF